MADIGSGFVGGPFGVLSATEQELLDGVTVGSITASKGVVRDANQGIPFATLVVALGAGTLQTDGTALTKDINLVTGSNSSKAAVLPTAVVGQVIKVVNTVSNATLPVFPATGAAINGATVNTAFTIGPAQEATFYCTALLTWYVELGAASTSTVAQQNYTTVTTAGTVELSKAVVVDANKHQTECRISAGGLYFGTSGSEVQVTASAAELNYLDITTLGNAEASKALTFDAYNTARIGDFAAAGASTGMVIFAANMAHYTDGQVDIFSGFGASTSDLTSAYSAKVGRFRHVVTTSTGSVAHETYGLVGQLVTRGTTSSHLHAGLMGTFEGNGAANVLSSSYSVGHAAVIGRIGGHTIITATTPLAGFLAFNNQSGAITGGSTCAFAASAFSASYPWTYGLYLPAGAVANGVKTTTTLTGVDVTVSALAAGGTTSGIRCAVTAAAATNDYGIAGYFDTTINGTTAGHCYGLGSWINTGATSPVLGAGHIIVPFEGGVYTGEAQANARIVFGGQHQAILGGVPASLHAWRLNTNRTITALIAAANPGSIGYTAGTGTGTAVGWVAFCEVVSGPTVGYVKIYSATA